MFRRYFLDAPERRGATDTAGAVGGLGAIHPPHCYGLLATTQPATSIRPVPGVVSGAPVVSRTRIAWQLPRAAVLHPPDARQRRS